MLREDRRGSALVLFALGMPIVFGLVGLGTEVGTWYATVRGLQTLSDAAAIGGAYAKSTGAAIAVITETARRDATRNNGFNGATDVVAVNVPPATGPNTGNANAVEAIVSRPLTLLFSRVFLTEGFTVQARSVAVATPPGQACALALAPGSEQGIRLDSNATVDLGGCGMAANSTAADAIRFDSNSSLTAASLNTVGGFQARGNSTQNLGSPAQTGQSPILDPYADLGVPQPLGSCTSNGLRVRNNATLSPGRYCGGLRIDSNSTVNFQPGVYIIDGGVFDINSNVTVNGTGVTFILTGHSGLVRMDSNVTANLTAPTAGGYRGVLFYQDRNVDSSGSANEFKSNVRLNVNGAFYFPSREVRFDSNSNLTVVDGGCSQIIARTIRFDSNATVTTRCPAGSPRDINLPPKIRLIE
ncbi:MAG: TadE/TadG family type IV pilus assembly protein [Pseudomonadota bacterium]